MKAKFTTFSGGLLTGLLLVLLLSSASREKTDPEKKSTSESASLSAAESGFHLVPIDTFYKNVARYRSMHVKAVLPDMPRIAGPNGLAVKKPARMFIYTISWLEKFFILIRAAAIEGGLDPNLVAIRFYYGVYPNGQTIGGHNYGKLHTLYMVPNYWSEEDQRYRDIEILGLADEMKKADANLSEKKKNEIIKKYYLENIHDANRNAGVFVLDASTVAWKERLPSKTGSLLFPDPPVINQGQLCPPNCPTQSLLDDIDTVYPGRVE